MSEGSALDWLLASDEPAVRYRAMTELLGRAEDDREVIEARRAIPRGPLVKALLAGLEPGGSALSDPYRKFSGSHWRLVSLADLRFPPGDRRLRPAIEVEFGLGDDERHPGAGGRWPAPSLRLPGRERPRGRLPAGVRRRPAGVRAGGPARKVAVARRWMELRQAPRSDPLVVPRVAGTVARAGRIPERVRPGRPRRRHRRRRRDVPAGGPVPHAAAAGGASSQLPAASLPALLALQRPRRARRPHRRRVGGRCSDVGGTRRGRVETAAGRPLPGGRGLVGEHRRQPLPGGGLVGAIRAERDGDPARPARARAPPVASISPPEQLLQPQTAPFSAEPTSRAYFARAPVV